jgi:hypothetical protein
VGQGDGGIVIGDLAGGAGRGAAESDAVVDVENGAGGAAGRLDDVGRLVLLGVDLAVGPDTAARDARGGGGGLRGGGGEVVGRVEGRRGARVELGIPVVGGVDDGEGVSRRVVEAKVELAVVGVVLDRGSWSDVGLEAIEAEGDDLGERQAR